MFDCLLFPLMDLPIQGCSKKDVCPFEKFKVNTKLTNIFSGIMFKITMQISSENCLMNIVSYDALAGKDSQAKPEARLRHAMQGKAAGRHGGALLSQLQAFQLLPGHVLAERVPCQGRRCEDGAVDLPAKVGSMAGRPRAATARDVV